MSDNPELSARLELDTSAYTKSLQDVVRVTEDFDTSLDELIKNANQAEDALQGLSTDVKIELDTDTSSIETAQSELEALGGMDADISISVDVDESQLSDVQTSLDTLDSAAPDITINVDDTEVIAAQTVVDTLDSEAPDIPVSVDDSELTTAQTAVDDLDSEAPDIPITAETSDIDKDTESIKGKLDTLQKLAIINIAMTLIGKIPGPDDIPLLNTIIEADKASRSIVANLGEMGKQNQPQYSKQATDVYSSGAFDTQQAAADALSHTIQLTHNDLGDLTTTGENFATVTEQGFATAKAHGEDFNKVIEVADTLVSTGLVPTYSDAFDLINTGFQEGLDKGGQFLDTLREKSTVLVDMGLDGQTSLGLIKIGLDNGAKSANEVLEVIGSLDEKIKSAASGSGANYDLFKKLGLKDDIKAYNAGTETGGQFTSALLAAIEAKKGTRGFDTDAVTALFGGKVQDLTLDVAMKFDPAQAQSAVSEVKGATLDTQIQVMGDLGTSWESLKRTVETDLATSVSTAFDIPGKIQQFNDGVREFTNQIANGATIPQAIEVAFQVPGFADTASHLESALGNLGIVLLQVAASILDAIGQGGAAETVRGTATQAAAGQMAFDLKMNAGNAEAIQATIQTAIDRGVDSSTLAKGIQTAGEEFIKAGDLESAQTLLTSLQGIATVDFPDDIKNFLSGKGIDPTNIVASKQALIDFKAEVDRVAEGGGGMFTGLQPGHLEQSINATDIAAAAATAAAPLQEEFQTASDNVGKAFQGMTSEVLTTLPGFAQTTLDTIGPLTQAQQGIADAVDLSRVAFTTMTTTAATDNEAYASTLSTATSNVNDFAGNATEQIGTNIPTANDEAILSFDLLGIQVTGIMTQAKADLDDFVKHYLGLGSIDVTVPNPVIGGTGGGTGSHSHAAGGTIQAGNIDTVHGGEQLVGPYAGDVSVLNRQTSGVLDSAVAQYMAAAGMMGGGGGANTNITINNTFNNSGAAASNASLNATSIRGY